MDINIIVIETIKNVVNNLYANKKKPKYSIEYYIKILL
jgi:hypothetical protein